MPMSLRAWTTEPVDLPHVRRAEMGHDLHEATIDSKPATEWDNPLMARPLLLALATGTVLAIVATATWADRTNLSMSECLDQEAKGYPHLEQVAQEIMGSVGEQIRRGSFCEDAVLPGAFVRVPVYDWTTRKEAQQYFREAPGVSVLGEHLFASQGVGITYWTSVDDLQNGGERYVKVTFHCGSGCVRASERQP
jgi:hypothetical protein